MTRINDMVDDMKQFGGVLMVNWHDRSIAPERLWDDFYAKLVGTSNRPALGFAPLPKQHSGFGVVVR